MRDFIEKFSRIKKEVAAERGDPVLFALVEREGSGGKWDLVVSASWFGENKAPALDYLAGKARSVLSLNELLSLSRIVLLDPTEEFVRDLSAYVAREGTDELRDVDLHGMLLTRAHLFTHPPEDCAVDEDRSWRSGGHGPPTTVRQASVRQ